MKKIELPYSLISIFFTFLDIVQEISNLFDHEDIECTLEKVIVESINRGDYEESFEDKTFELVFKDIEKYEKLKDLTILLSKADTKDLPNSAVDEYLDFRELLKYII